MRRPRRGWSQGLAFLALLLLPSGCREEFGPVRFKTTRVVGVVRIGNRPVSGGWIEFLPVAGTVGNLRSAAIGPDGTFEVDHVPVGINQLGFLDMPIDRNIGRIFHPLSSPIRRTIAEGASTIVEIDLLEEVIRFKNTLQGG